MKNKKSKFHLNTVRSIIALLLVPSFFLFGTSQEQPSAIAVHMKAINKGFRELRRQVKDSEKKNENLALVTELKKHVAGAQEEEPTKAQDLPESDRTPFLEAYRALLDEVIATLDKLETTIKEDKPEAASELLKQLNDLKKKGHGKFQD